MSWTPLVSDDGYYDRTVGYWYTRRFWGERFVFSLRVCLEWPWFTMRVYRFRGKPRRREVPRG